MDKSKIKQKIRWTHANDVSRLDWHQLWSPRRFTLSEMESWRCNCCSKNSFQAQWTNWIYGTWRSHRSRYRNNRNWNRGRNGTSQEELSTQFSHAHDEYSKNPSLLKRRSSSQSSYSLLRVKLRSRDDLSSYRLVTLRLAQLPMGLRQKLHRLQAGKRQTNFDECLFQKHKSDAKKA